jgi:RNA polymerase sigma factor (sigma-70 family)
MSRSDAELVVASRGGNREAFGQIVRKYQGMVSGLIYAACGDLHRSEDLAQETFISAWKSLSGLREPGKLAGWLCGIARHRVADQFRESATEKIRLMEEMGKVSGEEEPVDQVVVAEEREMLWRTLSRIPQPYRETMVLYYRQGQSTAEVAAAMETTDEGVRQRLLRGRKMLREEMAEVVERGLVRTAPGPEFAMGVLGALPLAAGQVGGLAVTAKGSAAAKGGGLLVFLTAWVTPILAVLSLGLITGQSIYRAPAGREKRFVIGYWVVFWGCIAGWVLFSIVLVGYGQRRGWNYSVFVPVEAVTWCLYSMVLYGLTAYSSSRTIANLDVGRPGLMRSFWTRFVFITPLIYLGVGWLVRLAIRAGDRRSAEVIVVAALVGSAICVMPERKSRRHNPVRMLFMSWLCMVVIVLAALNLRMIQWMVVVDHMGLAELRKQVSMWSVNVCGGGLVGWMVLVFWWSTRKQMKVGEEEREESFSY